MTALPYRAAAFDAVVCLWTAFNELLEEDEQLAALREMHRVLAPGGVAVVDGPAAEPATAADIAAGVRRGIDHRIIVSIIAGHRLDSVAHDAASLGGLAAAAGISDWQVPVRDWAGRQRQLLVFRK